MCLCGILNTFPRRFTKVTPKNFSCHHCFYLLNAFTTAQREGLLCPTGQRASRSASQMQSTRRATINQHPLPGKDHHHQNSAETQRGEGCYHLLDRPGQVVLAQLRSGHNRLNAHMHRKLKIGPSPTCPCGEEDQTTELVVLGHDHLVYQ